MPQPPPEDVEKIQVFLSDNSKVKVAILWNMQHIGSKGRFIVKRIHKRDKRAACRREHN